MPGSHHSDRLAARRHKTGASSVQAAFRRIEAFEQRHSVMRRFHFVRPISLRKVGALCSGVTTSAWNTAFVAVSMRERFPFPVPYLAQARFPFFYDGIPAAYLR
jgi:hypothetical protein